MSTFVFAVRIKVTNDMQGETGEDFARQELEGDLEKLPHSYEIIRCEDETNDD